MSTERKSNYDATYRNNKSIVSFFKGDIKAEARSVYESEDSRWVFIFCKVGELETTEDKFSIMDRIIVPRAWLENMNSLEGAIDEMSTIEDIRQVLNGAHIEYRYMRPAVKALGLPADTFKRDGEDVEVTEWRERLNLRSLRIDPKVVVRNVPQPQPQPENETQNQPETKGDLPF